MLIYVCTGIYMCICMLETNALAAHPHEHIYVHLYCIMVDRRTMRVLSRSRHTVHLQLGAPFRAVCRLLMCICKSWLFPWETRESTRKFTFSWRDKADVEHVPVPTRDCSAWAGVNCVLADWVYDVMTVGLQSHYMKP